MKDKLYCLLSYWGHVLAIDHKNKQTILISIQGFQDESIEMVMLEHVSDGGSSVVGKFRVSNSLLPYTIDSGTLPGCISLISNETWVCANITGKMSPSNHKDAWENFFCLPISDLKFLKENLLSYFKILESDSQFETIYKLGLKHFNIIFGKEEYPLHLNSGSLINFQDNIFQLSKESRSECFTKCSNPNPSPSIWIRPLGGSGNVALQYLTAQGIRELAPSAKIENIQLGLFGIHQPSTPRPSDDCCMSTGDSYSIDVKGLSGCLNTNQVDSIAIEGFTFCIDHYPARQRCREIVPVAVGANDVSGFSEDYLVCNIRGGEILHGIHVDYFPLPAEYYKLLEKETGLKMVFFGQIGDDPYCENLRYLFPDALFVKSQGGPTDFETIRRSKNIAICISTFSWLAAWLSNAQRIYVPIGGMFNPTQFPGQDYLPVNDQTYHFVILPIARTVNLYELPDQFWRMQQRIAKLMRFATHEEVFQLSRRGKISRRANLMMTTQFNSDFYCSRNLEASFYVLSLQTCALNYYFNNGNRGDKIFDFNEAEYEEHNPNVAIDVALGLSPTSYDHFLHEGNF